MTTTTKRQQTFSGIRYEIRDLYHLPAINHSEYGDLKIETKRSRVYLLDKQVTLIKLIDNAWVVTNQYQAE